LLKERTFVTQGFHPIGKENKREGKQIFRKIGFLDLKKNVELIGLV